MFKLLRKGTKSDFYIIIGILLLFLFKATLSLYLNLDTYEQAGISVLVNVLILVIVLITLKNKIKNQQELSIRENLLNGLLQESRATLSKIISTSQDPQIKEPALQLNEMIENMRTFKTVKSESDYQPEKLLKSSKINRRLRKGIIAILIALMIGSLFIYTEMVVELTESKMVSDATFAAADWWTIYGSNLLLGIILFLIFLLCIIVVDLFIDRLFDWQDSVNNQLEKAIDNAYAAGKAKSQFFAQMSHEIRTPINAVIGMNEMILRECNDSSIIKYAQNAHAASESLLSLINDILDFSKLESDKMELIEETYKLDELIRTLINMIKFRAEKKDLDFRVMVNENIPNELSGDSTRIRQVVVNFLTNAVKYTKVGGIIFTVDMELGLDEDTGVKRQMGELLLKFSVKDSGIGIREEDKAKLFKDFERFDSKQNKNIEGTGLGLAITAKLVKLMRGAIEVESVYGEGSTFTVLVPQKIIGKKPVGRFEEKVKVEKSMKEVYKVSFVAPSAKILVVDDNEMNLLVATSLLKATKIQVDTAMSGMAALKKLQDTHYDLVFLDQMMPNLDGIQTLKIAKEMDDNKSKGVPMIALTANATSGAREMFLREGFTDYLSKPIDARELEKMLADYLPAEKLKEPQDVTAPTEKSQPPQVNRTKATKYTYLDTNLGLQYSAGIEDMYRNILEMFCNLKDDKKAQIISAFNGQDWN
ncbi:MAG: response regulator, partial [Selenomonadaceae bacterium]|nr:response regulator [Selenomonadaceae bacterium]